MAREGGRKLGGYRVHPGSKQPDRAGGEDRAEAAAEGVPVGEGVTYPATVRHSIATIYKQKASSKATERCEEGYHTRRGRGSQNAASCGTVPVTKEHVHTPTQMHKGTTKTESALESFKR